mgnify:CR=1 FL=1
MKIRKFLLGLIAMALLCVISPVHAEETNADFDQFMRNEFIEMMGNDYISLHFALKDYENMVLQNQSQRLVNLQL